MRLKTKLIVLFLVISVIPMVFVGSLDSSVASAVGVLVGLIVIVMAVSTAKSIAAPLQQLTGAAEDISKGRLDTKIDPILLSSQDEIGQLASSFNDMAHNLQTSYEALQLEIAEQLRVLNESLEQRVAERTRELSNSNLELQAEITERKRAEVELARSNAELEQFAYVASHDLQEPLRAIVGFTSLLTRRYQAQLGGDAERYMEHIVNAASRMQQLIQDLLQYSRVGRDVQDFKPTECECIVTEEISNLQAAIEESSAVVTHDPLPTLGADTSLLSQLFRNLIGNAIKFHGEEPPRVHISGDQREAELVLSVRDNGIGIEPEYAQRIFNIFQRLHTREEYPGSGIGLSVCKKAVERMGGRIWVESQPGEGSTFYFTVPIAREDERVTGHPPIAISVDL